jgi:hypothetical protein
MIQRMMDLILNKMYQMQHLQEEEEPPKRTPQQQRRTRSNQRRRPREREPEDFNFMPQHVHPGANQEENA